MKSILLISILLCSSVFASTELELLTIMRKDFDDKEITTHSALCKEYKHLFNNLTDLEKSAQIELVCRIEASVDAEKKSEIYLAQVQNQIDTMSNTNKTLDEQQVNIIVQQMNPLK